LSLSEKQQRIIQLQNSIKGFQVVIKTPGMSKNTIDIYQKRIKNCQKELSTLQKKESKRKEDLKHGEGNRTSSQFRGKGKNGVNGVRSLERDPVDENALHPGESPDSKTG